MDQKLLLLINHTWTSPALDRFMAVLSCFSFWAPIFAVAVAAIVVWGGFRGRAFLLTLVCFIGINDSLVANGLKHAIHRLRPCQALTGVRVVRLAKAHPEILGILRPPEITESRQTADYEQGRSFPSGHTINTLTAAIVTLLCFPRFGWAGLPVPFLVGYSRIYVGAHWPTDVFLSFFIATGATLLLACVAERLWKTQASRHLPRLYAQSQSLFSAA